MPAQCYQRVDANLHRLEKVGPICLEEGAAKRGVTGIGDRMDQKIQRAQRLARLVESCRDLCVVIHVARHDQPRPDRFGQLAHAAFHLRAREMVERQLRALGVGAQRNLPRERSLVRHAEDKTSFPVH
jgi:hypothetical protein